MLHRYNTYDDVIEAYVVSRTKTEIFFKTISLQTWPQPISQQLVLVCSSRRYHLYADYRVGISNAKLRNQQILIMVVYVLGKYLCKLVQRRSCIIKTTEVRRHNALYQCQRCFNVSRRVGILAGKALCNLNITG
jgi:hypothetical protein